MRISFESEWINGWFDVNDIDSLEIINKIITKHKKNLMKKKTQKLECKER